jgi:hypothetical protein
MDIYGKALKDYQSGVEDQSLILNTSYGEAEEMPVWYFFRGYEEMPEMEQMALSIADGDILDIGAGAIDTSEVAVEIMRNDGLKRAVKADFFEYQGGQYDTMIMLMNGIGLVGTLDGFRQFLNHAKKLLKPEGQLIFDTSDIKYLYEGKALPKDKYYGEVSFQYEYQGIKGEWFDWIYIDENTLEDVAEECGWFVYYLHKDENDQYLVRMIPKIED